MTEERPYADEETVTVPVRDVVLSFLVGVSLTVPFPEPELGVTFIHESAVTVQFVLDSTETVDVSVP